MATGVKLRVTFYLMGVRNTVEGFREFERFSRLKLDEHIQATAEKILLNARTIVPRSPGGGTLAQSLKVAPLRIKRYKGKQVEAETPYALWVEYGTRASRGGAKGKIPPFGPGTPLHDWATRAGLPPAGVAFNIKKKGVVKHPFMHFAAMAERKRYYDGVVKIVFDDAPTHIYQSKGRLSLRSKTKETV